MRRTIEPAKTLLVDGPASIAVQSGKATVLGAPIKKEKKLVIREGKRLPFEMHEKTVIDLVLGNGASYEEIDGSTIPSSWRTAATKIVSLRKPVTAVIIGAADSGKTSFCTFFANEAVERRQKVALIDADLGQSDIGPPSTIGFSRITSYVRDLFELEADESYFVGVTSPTGAVKRILEGLDRLKARALEAGVDLLIMNTDGWVEGEDAAGYKISLVDHLSPDVVVAVQHEEELARILNSLEKTDTITVDSPPMVHKRSREKRKTLRELGYTKHLKNAKVQSFHLNWIKTEGGVFGVGSVPSSETMRVLEDSLGKPPLYCEETTSKVFVVLRQGQRVNEEQIQKASERLGKKLKVIVEGEEEGLLTAFHDHGGKFLGIGILCGADYKRKIVKAYTPVSKDVAVISFGQIKLDKQGRETGLSTVYANYCM